MNAHIFRPFRSDTAAGRVQCVEPGCLLTPDEHMEAMAGAVAETPRRAGRPPGARTMPRELRARFGLPVCGEGGCHRAPSKGRGGKFRPLCPLHARAAAKRTQAPAPPVPHAPYSLKVPVPLLNGVALAAERERISGAEWVRRAIAAALGTAPRAPEKSVIGPDETDLAGYSNGSVSGGPNT